MRILFQFIGLLVIAFPACAGEYAVLDNGFRLHADRHEVDGGLVRLYADGGMTQIAAHSIDHFEAEEILPAPAPAPPAEPARVVSQVQTAHAATPEELAAQAAKKYSLPESFVRSVMKAESALHQEAMSPKGALGLMQLMPETARQLGVDPKNPKENAEGGAQYLRDLLARYEDRTDQVNSLWPHTMQAQALWNAITECRLIAKRVSIF